MEQLSDLECQYDNNKGLTTFYIEDQFKWTIQQDPSSMDEATNTIDD